MTATKRDEMLTTQFRSQTSQPRISSRLISKLSRTLLVLALFIAPTDSAHSQLAFTVNIKGRWDVFVQGDLDLQPRHIEEQNQADAVAPALAPDGKRVAFEVPGEGIRVCPTAGSGPCTRLQVADGYGVRPAWRPGTGELLFVRYKVKEGLEDSDIFIATGMNEPRPLVLQTGTQDYPDVSADGRLLAYTSTVALSLRGAAAHVVQQLWVMDLQSGRGRQLVTTEAQDIQPDWSPSGRQVAFASNRSGQFEIWVVNLDSSGLRQVTSGPGAKTWPAWSPDGKSIMFTMVTEGHQSLRIIDADGSDLRRFEPFGSGLKIELKDADWR